MKFHLKQFLSFKIIHVNEMNLQTFFFLLHNICIIEAGEPEEEKGPEEGGGDEAGSTVQENINK
jgi:hypothetical protein